MSGKALAARGFEPQWGKRKVPAFVSKAGTSYGIKRYRQVLCANSFTSLAELSLHRAGKARDPEMHQIRKGNEWRFGMKCHVGVDAGGGLVHTVTVTSANKHDITETVNLIREDDEVVYGDSGYLGVQKRSEIQQNEHFSKVDFRINRRPKSLPKVSDHAIDWERYIEHRKSSIRSKVEHVFRIIKCQFGYKKVVYRGLKKNENRLYALFACANLYSLAIAGRKLSTT